MEGRKHKDDDGEQNDNACLVENAERSRSYVCVIVAWDCAPKVLSARLSFHSTEERLRTSRSPAVSSLSLARLFAGGWFSRSMWRSKHDRKNVGAPNASTELRKERSALVDCTHVISGLCDCLQHSR